MLFAIQLNKITKTFYLEYCYENLHEYNEYSA